MRQIPCPVSSDELKQLYADQRLTDQQICQVLGQGATLKRVRSWRSRYGIPTLPRLLRNEVSSIEGTLKSLLVGSMLGDGRLVRTPNGARYIENHAADQLAYLEWKVKQWGPWRTKCGIKPVTWRLKGVEYPGYRFHTYAHPNLIPWWELFYPTPGPKQLNPAIVDHVDAYALTIWFLDDGYAGWRPILTFGMSLESRQIAYAIFEKFGLTPNWYTRKKLTGEFRLDDEAQADRFIEIIKPHVPESMSYKLKFGFQGRAYDIRKASPEETLREMATNNVPIRVMAKELGLSASVVSRRLERLGIKHLRTIGRPKPV